MNSIRTLQHVGYATATEGGNWRQKLTSDNSWSCRQSTDHWPTVTSECSPAWGIVRYAAQSAIQYQQLHRLCTAVSADAKEAILN